MAVRQRMILATGLVLALSTLGAAPAALAAPNRPVPETQAARQAGPAPKNCTYDSDGNGMVCVTIKKKATRSTFKVAWQEELENTLGRTSRLECVAESSKTWTYNVSASVEAEAGVIFAKAKTQAGISITHSRSSGRMTKVGVDVPARTTTLCERGVRVHYFQGTMKHTRCNSSTCTTRTKKFKMRAPSTAAWRFRDV